MKRESRYVLPYRKKREDFETFCDYFLRIGRNNGFNTEYSFNLFLRKAIPQKTVYKKKKGLTHNFLWNIEHYSLQILLGRKFTCEDYDLDPELIYPPNRKICERCYSLNDVVPYLWYEENRKDCHICGSALVHKLDDYYINSKFWS